MAGRAKQPILIAGAGIAGLALALGLAKRGISCRLLERRQELSEAGAGIQLGPNAMHVLRRLGVAAALEAECGRPTEIYVCDGGSGRHIGSLPLGPAMEARYGAPYRVCHRADLQDALAQAVRAAGVPVVTGFEVEHWVETDVGIIVDAADGRSERGDILVGADGIWSPIRRLLHPGLEHRYAGKMAARALAPADLVAERFTRAVTGVWLGPSAHVVHYPIRAGREVAVVCIVDEPVAREGWGGQIDVAAVLHKLDGFAPELQDLLQLASGWRSWSLYDPAPLPSWSRGRVGLIGDAAHPVLPFLAQGGAMALEDAETLAAILGRDAAPAPAGAAFVVLEKVRRARVLKVQDASRANGRIFHMSGMQALARNVVLSIVPGSMMMSRYDWLYRWNGDDIATG